MKFFFTKRSVKNELGKDAELERLNAQYLAAMKRAAGALQASGRDSDAFMKAETEVATIMARMKEILGI